MKVEINLIVLYYVTLEMFQWFVLLMKVKQVNIMSLFSSMVAVYRCHGPGVIPCQELSSTFFKTILQVTGCDYYAHTGQTYT